MAYADGRYQVRERINAHSVICHDQNLDRRVCIHWVAPASACKAVRARLAALQSVHSPYVALIYDLVEKKANGRVGVVEENLGAAVETTVDNRLRSLYELCAGLTALHASHLAHGALDENSFRVGPLGHGRLCNLAFADDQLDVPTTDRAAFAALLDKMGASLVEDDTFKKLYTKLAASRRHAPPSAQELRDRLAALLLHNQHRALVYWQGTSIELGSRQPSAHFVHPRPGVASVTISYDGTRFFIADVNGEVRVNNVIISRGTDLPSSCVLVLGGIHRPWHDRYSITFDQSHPEVA